MAKVYFTEADGTGVVNVFVYDVVDPFDNDDDVNSFDEVLELVEENSNHSDTSLCQRPPWSSPPCCPCHPQCCPPPTHMYLIQLDMLKV